MNFRPVIFNQTKATRLAGHIFVGAVIGAVLVLPSAVLANKGKTSPEVVFENASGSLQGFIHTNNTDVGDNVSGVAWLDCDNDDDLDLYVANGNGADDGLLINDGNGVFTNIVDPGANPNPAGDIGDGNGSSGVAAADLDNHGNTDIVVAGDAAFLKGVHSSEQIRVYKGHGDCSFTDVTHAAFDAIGTERGSALTISLGDINNDGLLDVFVTAPSSLTTAFVPENRMFLNDGNFVFTDISGIESGAIYAAGACNSAFTHYDDDGYIDLLIGDCNLKLDRPTYQDFLIATGLPFPPFVTTPLRMLRNNGDNSFTRLEVNLPEPPLPIDQQMPPLENGFWMSSTLGDIDADGDLDVFSSNVGEFFSPLEGFPGLPPGSFAQEHYLGERLADGTYQSIEGPSGIEAIATKFSWGASFTDLNNDGWEDLFFAGNLPELGAQTGNPGYLFVNKRDKTFRNDPQPVDLSCITRAASLRATTTTTVRSTLS